MNKAISVISLANGYRYWQVICFIPWQMVCMKFVSLVIVVLMISCSAAAQTTRHAAEKGGVVKTQQKLKSGKAKTARTKGSPAKNGDVVTLTDETSNKAKQSFEQLLMRRLEVDAEEGERERQRQKE